MDNRLSLRKLNNKGFSLVELIVTIMIIAIISVSVGVTISVVYGADAEKATEVFCSEMSVARREAMSLDDSVTGVFLRLYTDSNGDYVTDVCRGDVLSAAGYSVLSSQKLANHKIDFKVGVKNAAPADLLTIDAGGDYKEIRYSFAKSGGAINNIVAIDGSANMHPYKDASGTTDNTKAYVDVYVSSDDEYHVIVVLGTGRCYEFDE